MPAVSFSDSHSVERFDPRQLPTAFYADPYPTYHDLRRTAPVFRCPDGTFFLTAHADLDRVYRDPRTFSSDKQQQFRPVFGDSPLYEHHTTSLVFNDPPLHTHVRKAVGDALSPRAVAAMTPALEALVDGLIDALPSAGAFDLVDDFASVIPVEVIGNLLRIPHAERGPLRGWSAAILGALEFGVTDATRAAGNQAVTAFVDYLRALIAERRRQLSSADDDVLSRLLQWESNGERLSEHQLYHQCIFLLNAGHETTTNLIGNSVHAVLNTPSAHAALLANPALTDTAIEEFLRYDAPVQLGNRLTTTTVEIHGVTIPAGSTLTLCVGAANRDPAVFESPDALKLDRRPNPQLAFGGGIHTCAGLHVARLEARIALTQLFSRLPRLALAGTPERAQRARFRGFTHLPVTAG